MNFAINDQNEIYFNLEVLSSPSGYVQLLSDTLLLNYTGRVVFEDESWGLSIFTKHFSDFAAPCLRSYVVALPNYEIQVPKVASWECPQHLIVNMLIKRLQFLKTTTTPALAEEDAHIVGLWVDKGEAYIDFCKTFERLEDALAYAKAGKQKAIFDRLTQKTIEVN